MNIDLGTPSMNVGIASMNMYISYQFFVGEFLL